MKYFFIAITIFKNLVRNFEFSFFNSSNLNQLQIINDVNPSNGILYFASDGPLRRGEIWYNQQVQIRGFTTKFEFRILNATTGFFIFFKKYLKIIFYRGRWFCFSYSKL